MSPPPVKNSDLDFVLNNLRVPDFQYKSLSDEDCEQQNTDFINRLALSGGEVESLTAFVKENYPSSNLSPRLYNTVFLIDRTFEIWQRKNGLDPALVNELLKWRAVLLSAILKSKSELVLSPLDTSIKRFRGWCENPERAKKIVPNLLSDLAQDLLVSTLDNDSLDSASQRLKDHVENSVAKSEKVAYRLLNQELINIRSEYSGAVSGTFINQMFVGRDASEKAIHFLNNYWFEVLKAHVLKRSESTLASEIITLTKRFRAVFVERGKAAMKYSEDLIEDLELAAKEQGISVPSDLWSQLSQEIIEILKGEPQATNKFAELTNFDKPNKFSTGKKPVLNEGDWLLDPDTSHRMQLYHYFKDFGHYLFVNHLGMKMKLLSERPLKELIASKELVKLGPSLLVSDVLIATTKGLTGVAEKQRKRRELAAEKARQEAENLLKAQQEAAAIAQQKAEEIQLRAKQISDKKQAAIRSEQEAEALKVVTGLNLGAWVSIEDEGEKNRFKLAVKFAASGRYIFVDKYGVKKLEFVEEALVAKICNGEIGVLNDGADFDASLERVIGRIRLAQ